MSYDLQLTTIAPSETADEVCARIKSLAADLMNGSGSPDHHLPVALAITQHDHRYRISECYFCDLLGLDRLDAAARSQYKYIQLDGPDDEKLAQIVIHANYIVVHCCSGTGEDELDAYLRIICRETSYAVFDPQSDTIERYSEG